MTRRANAHRQNALQLQLVNLVAFGAFAVTAITGVVQANLAFTPEKVRTQKRDPSALLKAADGAMYAGKEKGKDRLQPVLA